ncbi:MAG: SufS family cysteine desulfurase [Pseudomonadota bacterium]
MSPVAARHTAPSIRADFPALQREVHGQPLVYLDSAATSQKPQAVIDAVAHYYAHYNANVHRAAHQLADEATRALEAARAAVASFIGAPGPDQVVFTRGTTEAINLVAAGLTNRLQAGDEILLTELEHHSNIVPWQLLAQRTGARIEAVRVTETGELDLDDFERKLTERTRVFAVGHVSNALGTVNPVQTLITAARAAGAVTIVDGAQAAAHVPIDVAALGCDFYALSAHKCFGPTGIGALYGTAAALEALPPWQGGGEMIATVSLRESTWNRVPYRFEAGTPNIAGAIGFGAAIEYMNAQPLAELRAAEAALVTRAADALAAVNGITLVGRPEQRSGSISFVPSEGTPDDIGTLLDRQGVAVRTGHHCTMPLMEALDLPGGTVRASFSLYNDDSDVERLLAALSKALSFL